MLRLGRQCLCGFGLGRECCFLLGSLAKAMVDGLEMAPEKPRALKRPSAAFWANQIVRVDSWQPVGGPWYRLIGVGGSEMALRAIPLLKGRIA